MLFTVRYAREVGHSVFSVFFTNFRVASLPCWIGDNGRPVFEPAYAGDFYCFFPYAWFLPVLFPLSAALGIKWGRQGWD